MCAQSCLAFSNTMNCSPPGSSVHRISQARVLEWVAISFSRGIFPTQGWNRGLLHWQVDSLPLSHLGSLNKEERALNKPGSPGSGVGIKKIPFIPRVYNKGKKKKNQMQLTSQQCLESIWERGFLSPPPRTFMGYCPPMTQSNRRWRPVPDSDNCGVSSPTWDCLEKEADGAGSRVRQELAQLLRPR